jgi:uncharacterized protein YcaQ
LVNNEIALTSVAFVSLSEARFLVINKQRLTPSTQGKSKEDVVDIVRSLCGVQYDPLPVIAQAHYVTLWNRVKEFRESWLDSLLYEERRLIEFMLMRRTLNIISTEELPYYYQGTRSVARAGWIQRVIDRKEDETSQEIFRKVREKGEVSPRDFHYAAFRPLFYSGKIFISHREKGVFKMPYYSLFSKYFPDIKLDSIDEASARRHLVLKTLSAYGLSPTRHIAYWIGYKVNETEGILQKLEKEGVVTKVKIEGIRGLHWIGIDDFNKLKTDTGKEDFVALLTLMDNLIRDRKWLEQFFNYAFEVEYFQKKGMRWHVNILYNNEFLGFINPKIDRPRKLFIIKDIVLKRGLEDVEWERVLERMKELADFHNAEAIMVTKTDSTEVQKALQKHGFSGEKNGKLVFVLN